MNLDDLLAERGIYRKLVTFAQAMDERRWQLIDDIAAADMTANLGMGELQGLPHIVDFIRSFLDQCGPTRHLLANVIIDINGDTASSSAYVSDSHVGRGDKSELNFRTLGQYHDHWQKIECRWLMTRRVKVNRAVIGSLEALGSDVAP